MAEYSDAFGERVRGIMAARNLTPWEVERQARGDISHMTVRQMQRGVKVGSDSILAFAYTAGQDEEDRARLAVELLRLAGRERFLEMVRDLGGSVMHALAGVVRSTT